MHGVLNTAVFSIQKDKNVMYSKAFVWLVQIARYKTRCGQEIGHGYYLRLERY